MSAISFLQRFIGGRSERGNRIFRGLINGLKLLWADRLSRFALLYFVALIIIAIIGPEITPYEYDAYMTENGKLLRASPPSADHLLGTTSGGFDVLSRLLYGTQATVITGLIGGTLIITIGLTVGVTAGYVGGTVETVLMRVTDFVYALPLIPFAIVLLGLVDLGFFSAIIVIGLILWRSSARVIRSQVLQIKQRSYVRAAKADGASTPRIIYKHIIPNVASMAVLYFSLGIGYSILAQAGLAFLGLVNPFVPSWGVILRRAYQSGYMADALWWSLPPGILISLTVLCAFLLGRRYEELVGEDADATRLEETEG